MLPDKGPFFYQCEKCGKLFSSDKKKTSLSDFMYLNLPKSIENLLIKIKCPECGSKRVRSKDWMIHK